MEPEPEPAPEPEPEQPHAGVEREIGESLLADGVPISFVLAEDEITSTTASGALDTPRPFMVHLSRQSYLPLVFDRLRDHFADSIPPHTDEMWCSYEGTPLKWCAPAPLPRAGARADRARRRAGTGRPACSSTCSAPRTLCRGTSKCTSQSSPRIRCASPHHLRARSILDVALTRAGAPLSAAAAAVRQGGHPVALYEHGEGGHLPAVRLDRAAHRAPDGTAKRDVGRRHGARTRPLQPRHLRGSPPPSRRAGAVGRARMRGASSRRRQRSRRRS